MSLCILGSHLECDNCRDCNPEDESKPVETQTVFGSVSIEPKQREDWDTYFLKLAKLVSTRATCKRAQHGSVLVQDRNIISTGYNGAPRLIQSCDERDICVRQEAGCAPGENYELCHAVHSEQNAICLAAKHGSKTLGATLYVTGLPCLICAKMIINAGISRVVFDSTGRYEDLGSVKLMTDANILVEAKQVSI